MRSRDPETPATARPFAVAPATELLASLSADGSRRWIDPQPSRGRFWRIRLAIGWALIALFVGLPHVTLGGHPGIFLDLATRQFTFFGVTLRPTDNLLLAALGATVIITVFAVTALWGRLWCGYACPQPVYLELVFRPLERLCEGSPLERARRARGGWTWERRVRLAAKWSAFTIVALLLALTFVSYFTSWPVLWQALTQAPLEHRGLLFATAFTGGLVLFDFGWFREQMCTVACPYGRLQTVLYDRDTVIVGYDARRGEPRGTVRARRDAAQGLWGDCVDCLKCVRTCPTGIDIRRGLQMECIGCAQCIEACDEVMDKLGKPRGLVRYTSLAEQSGARRRLARPRLLLYLGLLGAAGGALGALAVGRAPADVEILRSAREPFRTLPTGEIANLLRLRLTNHRPAPQTFAVTLDAPTEGRLTLSQEPVVVAPNQIATVEAVVKLPEQAFTAGRLPARFTIRSDADFSAEEEFLLLGPSR